MGKPFPFTVCKECASGSGSGGADGLSAYEIAVKNGFKGTEEEWLESLKGDTPQYVPATFVPIDEYDYGYVADIPSITELKAGAIARIIPDEFTSYPILNVNGLGWKEIRRYASDTTYDRYTIADIEKGHPIELVYDGEYWICSQMCKPMAGDVLGLEIYLDSLLGNNSTINDMQNDINAHQTDISDIWSDLGSINSALDEIINIQQELINGGAQ